MSEKPEEKYKASKKVAEHNIEEQQPTPEPLDKQDPTEPVKVKDQREGKAMNITGSNAGGL